MRRWRATPPPGNGNDTTSSTSTSSSSSSTPRQQLNPSTTTSTSNTATTTENAASTNISAVSDNDTYQFHPDDSGDNISTFSTPANMLTTATADSSTSASASLPSSSTARRPLYDSTSSSSQRIIGDQHQHLHQHHHEPHDYQVRVQQQQHDYIDDNDHDHDDGGGSSNSISHHDENHTSLPAPVLGSSAYRTAGGGIHKHGIQHLLHQQHHQQQQQQQQLQPFDDPDGDNIVSSSSASSSSSSNVGLNHIRRRANPLGGASRPSGPSSSSSSLIVGSSIPMKLEPDHPHHPHFNHHQNSSDSNNNIQDDMMDDDDDVSDEDPSEEDSDDPGQDHAIPDEPSSIPNHETIWKPQNTTSTCEFTHTIANYSQKRESGCKKAEYSSTTIDNYGNRWRLIVYVNGNGRASNHHLSLFLQVADADDLPFGWKKGVSYVLTLEHPSGPTLGYAKRNPDKTFKLCPKAIDWGWSQFITSDRVQQEGYINDDSLTVRASVTVKSSSISIDPDDAELYLKCAVEEGNADAVEACLAQGASVNCKFKDDLYTPLHTACSSSTNDGSLDVLKLLLKRGANGNACNKWKETPLLIAANNGHRAAVEALLENGADPSMCSEAGWSALTFAAHKGYDDIVSLLLAAGAPVNCRVIEDFSTPLHKACAGGKKGHLSAVKQLISGEADVHSLNKWRETPLLTAANHGQASAVEALLDAGGDPCKCTDTGWSPLSIAAYKGHDDVVRLLLEQGAPTEEADPTLSALLQAATKGLPDTVELLLRHGADHTVTTKKGDTALSILVEQNLIDAAVEMVTEYKASVPRCSRDRKKVQRARLLINLRVKQQQREGLLNDSDTDDGSDHDDSDDGAQSALHDVDGTSVKKKGKSRETAEAQAKKAADALLLELDQEDAKAQKDEAAANSKRNKKKKKKERERQQKLEEERQRKAKEQKAADERERQKQLREEKERKEREARAKERREKEMRDAAERERIAAKRKEKEERERKKREQVKKEQMKKEQEKKERLKREAEIAAKSEKKKAVPKITSNDNASLQHSNHSKQKTSKTQDHPNQKQNSSQATKASETSKPTSSGKRGWEIKSKITNSQQKAPDTALPLQQFNTSESPKVSVTNELSKSSVEDQLENMVNSVVDFVVFESAQNISSDRAPDSSGTEVSSDSADQLTLNEPGSIIESSLNHNTGKSFAIETAALSIVRQEKVNELLHKANSSPKLASVDIYTVKTIIYKWIVRAAYDSTPFLDPVIPSWTDSEMLIAFFQRQIISESSRAGNVSGKIEVMKEAGTFLAGLCYSLAKEVVDFSKKYGESLPSSASDSTLNMIHSEIFDNNNTVISIDWDGHSKVYLTALSFSNLRNRYRGPSHLMLTSIFSTVKRYETMNMIVSGTSVNCRLSIPTLNELANEMEVSVELLSNPLSVLGKNAFSGSFADVDTLFGGSKPFSETGNDVEASLKNQGGSMAVLPPLDSLTASIFVKKITNILEVTEGKGLPVSVVVFLPMLCFRELKIAPRVEDLNLLEPELLTTHRRFIRHIELLPPGQHAFHGEDGQPAISHTGSMVLFLQNDVGGRHFPLTKHAVGKIIHSLSLPSPSLMTDIGSTSPTPFQVHEPIPASPTIPGSFSPTATSRNLVTDNTKSKGSSRFRGRLFDLVDDGDDDYTGFNGVPGINLNRSDLMFQNNSSQDVDIEAIGLGFLRIGTNPSNNGDDGSSMHQSRRFN